MPEWTDWTESTELCVTCPVCAFAFDSIHTSGEGYSCPACAEIELDRTIAALRALVEAKDRALDAAAKHVTELENTWLRGSIAENDGQGGYRSNRNVQVRGMVLDALALTEASMRERMEGK